MINTDALMNAGIITMVAGLFIGILGLMIVFCAFILGDLL